MSYPLKEESDDDGHKRTFTLPTNKIFVVGKRNEASHVSGVVNQAAFITTRTAKPLQTIPVCGSLFKDLHFIIEAISTVLQSISQERSLHDLCQSIS